MTFVVIKDFLDEKDDYSLRSDIQEELDSLENHAPMISLNPHARYKHLTADFLLKNVRSDIVKTLARKGEWSLLKIYNLPKLSNIVKHLTGWKEVYQLPLQTSQGFEINGKINFYDSRNESRLDWHFDKVFNYQGNQVVCDLTLQNDWDGEIEKPPTLEILHDTKKFEYLGGNTLSIHDPDTIFHRVLPFSAPKGKVFKRRVLVMRFTDNPTKSSTLQQNAGFIRYLLRHALYTLKVKDTKWIFYICFTVLFSCVFLCFLLLSAIRYQSLK
jgi:hypothetical protein